MTFTEICENVKVCIQDTEWGSENPDELKTKVNQAYQEITEETSVVIPELKTFTTITTSVVNTYVTIAADFSRLLRIVRSDGGSITILDGGLKDLIEMYPLLDDTGSVRYLAVEGSTLWYQGMPSVAETLVALYQKKVVKLVNTTDVPLVLPDHLQYPLLVNKAAMLCWREIEDGIEGDKVNTARYQGYYFEALKLFNCYLARRRSNLTRSVWDV